MAGSAQAATPLTTTGTENQTGTSNQSSATSGGSYGTTLSQQTADIPSWLMPLVQTGAGTAGQSVLDLQKMTNAFQLDPTAMAALQKTAGGDFLYGGAGQQEYIDAATRAAAPGINSTFGMAGRGGSGLNAAAFDQQALDSYAKLYQGERANQLSAAGQIPGLQMLPFQLQQQLATIAGGLPGQFAPFLGQTGLSAASGQTTGNTNTIGQTTQQGTTTQTQPLFEDPTSDWLKFGAAGLGLLAAPWTGGASLPAGTAAPSIAEKLFSLGAR